MEVYLVHYSTDHPNLLKRLLERIEQFCSRYESEANPDIFFEALTESYYSVSPGFLMFAGIEDGKMIGHAVYSMENFYGHKYVNMMQYWVDPDCKIDYKFKEKVFRDVKVWADEAGTDDVRIWARNEQVAELFEKVYGFERSEKVIMETSLVKVADRIAERRPAKKEEE